MISCSCNWGQLLPQKISHVDYNLSFGSSSSSSFHRLTPDLQVAIESPSCFSPVRKARRWSGAAALSPRTPPTSRRVTRHSIAAWPFARRKQEGALSVLALHDNNSIRQKATTSALRDARQKKKLGRISPRWGSERRPPRTRRC